MRARIHATSATSLVGSATIAVGLMAGIAGCGVSAGASGAQGPTLTGSHSTRAGRPASDRSVSDRFKAQTRAYARRMLTRAPLPPHAHPVRPGAFPASFKAAEVIGRPGRTISVTRYYRVTGTTAEATRFLKAHAPGGIVGLSTGEDRSGDVAEHFVGYNYKSMPDAVAANLLIETMLRASRHLIMLRIDAQAVPAIPRSATEHLNAADYRAVVVTFHRPLPSSGSVTKIFTSPAVIIRLAGKLNAMPTVSGLVIGCQNFTQTYRLVFEPRSAKDERVVAVGAPCDSVNVTVGSATQPALTDTTGLMSLISHMLNAGRGRPGHELPQ